ncbi:MAG: hypothetical protein QNJ51_30540 [Calothrix sp. MO_167.B12]|nr:hypothetical protein [Calothrix sp. MO_167.B12]
MAQFGAIYLSFHKGLLEKVKEISQIIKQEGYLFTVRYHHEAPWIQLYVEEPENVSNYSQKVSQIFPDKRVIGLAAYTVSDSVTFCEFKGGKVVRLLESGFQQERQWEKIEGDTQPWESEILGDMKIEIGSPGMVSYHIQKIGNLFALPGFGVPKSGEAWTQEIYN